MDTLTILVIVAVIVVVMIIYFYNKIVSLKVRVQEGWSDITVQLKRRHDLIGNLVETVKGYAKHEAGTLEKVVQARSEAKTAEKGSMTDMAAAEKNLSSAMSGLHINALAEQYPDLKANTTFQQLQAELADTENKVASSRRFYNTTVMSLNTAIQTFPGNLFAGLAGAEKQAFFELEEEEMKKAEKAPEVKF
ncbi:MAG: LemA family protein [bacterium]|nr:LemA family protein [bacterium]